MTTVTDMFEVTRTSTVWHPDGTFTETSVTEPVCREHLADEEPEVIQSAQPITDWSVECQQDKERWVW